MIPVGRAIMAMPMRLIKALRRRPMGGDGVDVTVTDGGEGDDGPPHPVADVGERFRLGTLFDVVHEDSREGDENEAGGVGRGQSPAGGA